MQLPFRIFRVSNVMRERDKAQIDEVREVVAEARRVLDDHERPDTFVGRKTGEPFRGEDDF